MRPNYRFIVLTAAAYALLGGEFTYEQEVSVSEPLAGGLPPTLAAGIPFGVAALLVYFLSTALFARRSSAGWILPTCLHTGAAVILGFLLGSAYYKLRLYLGPPLWKMCTWCPTEWDQARTAVFAAVAYGLLAALLAPLIGVVARRIPPRIRNSVEDRTLNRA